MSAMVVIEGLVKTYKRPGGGQIEAVKGIDLTIETGEIFSLLGPNGAGKTTTIAMMSGLVTPTAGDATIGGCSITREPLQAKRLIGVIPQEIALYDELSARQNLDFFGKMYGLSGVELDRRLDEVLEFIDLRDRQHDRVETFSGGMKRRVNIGVGLLHQPQLVYMDEPTVGIDPQSRRRILDTVFRLRDEQNMTVIYTTHLMEEAEELSDRIGIIDHGEIIALGTKDELTQQIGEEDRLFISVGEHIVPSQLLYAIKEQVEGVSDARYAAVDLSAETDDAGRSVDVRSSGTHAAVRAGQLVNGMIVVHVLDGQHALPRILRLVDDYRVEIQSVEVRQPDLEAVFLHLTGRELRE